MRPALQLTSANSPIFRTGQIRKIFYHKHKAFSQSPQKNLCELCGVFSFVAFVVKKMTATQFSHLFNIHYWLFSVTIQTY
jgi:hypothetical protein